MPFPQTQSTSVSVLLFAGVGLVSEFQRDVCVQDVWMWGKHSIVLVSVHLACGAVASSRDSIQNVGIDFHFNQLCTQPSSHCQQYSHNENSH